MIQRRAARYVSNCFRNTSSVSSMLDALQWESLESRKIKIQLTLLFKIIYDLVDIRTDDYLVSSTGRSRQAHSKKFRQISTDSYKLSFSPAPSQFRIPSQHQLLRPLWYLSRRGYPPYPSKQYWGPGCLVTHRAAGDIKGPGTATEGRVVFIWWAKGICEYFPPVLSFFL